MSELHQSPGLSRRQFLKTSALALAGMTASGLVQACQPAATPVPEATKAPIPTPVPPTKAPVRELNILYGTHDDFIPVMVRMFEEETGVKVNLEGAAGSELGPKYALMVAGQDTSYDLLYTWAGYSTQYGASLFENLDDMMPQAVWDDIVEATKSAVLDLKGNIVAMPLITSIRIFYWNTEMFEQMGLDPQKPPESWAEMIEVGQQYEKKFGKPAMINSMGSANAIFRSNWGVVLNSSGAKMYDEDATKVIFNSPEGVIAMEALKTWWDKGVVDHKSLGLAKSADVNSSFAAGDYLMMWSWQEMWPTWQNPETSKVAGKVAHGIIPGVILRSATVEGSEGYAVNRFSENKELAFEFLTFAASTEVQTAMATSTETSGLWGPARNSVMEDPKVIEANPVLTSVIEQGKYGGLSWGAPWYEDVAAVIEAAVRDVLNGKVSPKEAVDDAQQECQKFVDDYWASVG
jgi:multiple sugar transport system substrate-binding protein